MVKLFFNNKAKIKESEIRYRRLFETAKDGILILDFETGKITDANPYIVEIIDHPLNEIIGEKLWEIGLFSNKEESELAFKELKAKGYIRFDDMPIQRQNGKITEVEFVSNVYIENNKKVIQCNIRNITERKQTEKKQILTAKILTILNNLDNWDLSIKNILEEIKTYTGIEKIEIHLKAKEGNQLDDLTKLSEISGNQTQYLCKLNANDEIVYDRLEASYMQNIFEMVISGNTDSSLTTFTEGGSFYTNNFSGLLKANDKKQSQGNIPKETTKNNYESVALIPIYAGKEIIGLLQFEDSRPGMFGLQTIEFFEKTENSIGIAFIRSKNEDKIRENEQTLQEQNNNYQKLNNEYTVLNKQLNANINHIQNINLELLRAKLKAEESDKLKSAFLANVSHEIRTPLNAILGFTGLILDPKVSKEKMEDFIHIINASSLQLMSVISDIIDTSKIESGQITLETEVVDINNLINELYVTYKKLVELSKLSLTYSCDTPDEAVYIKTDGNKVKQIICNLLNNALKYTEEGNIEFGYKLKENYIEFYVKDTGIGIATKNHALIFQRFRQVENAEHQISRGNGLGLSISKALVEKMGGNISVNSEIGKGSTFYFTIPYIKSIENIVLKSTKTKPNHFIDWNKKTILIVEDEIHNHNYIEELLLETNTNILHAWCGKEAVDLVKSHSDISLVLMDIKMPVMDGYEALRLIKQIRPKLVVIAQTAYALSQDKSKALKAGFDSYISKPTSKEDLLDLMARYLN